jgi:hypothetical protein
MAALAQRVYAHVTTAADTLGNLGYLADVFERVEKQIWIDEWGHVTPEGNELIANHIATLLEAHLSNSK